MATSRNSLLIFTLLAGPSLFVGGCDGQTAKPGEAGGVALFSLPDVEGGEVEVATVPEGRLVLAFWATWCQPCQSELNKLDTLYADLHSRGLEIVAINVDSPDTVSNVAPWVDREGYRFPVLIDSESEILGRYHPRKEVPFYVVLDGEGRVVEDHQGYTPGDIDALRARLEAALSR